jgi:glycosyltransferase involved in cell wall biosynthesis
MLTGECIVCFAPDPWDDIWRNRHRLLGIFARTNRVLYVEPRTALRTLARKIRTGAFSPSSLLRRRVEEVRENLFVYHDPVFLPRTERRGLGPALDRWRDATFRRALGRLGFANPILWLVRPESWDVPGTIGEKALIYQVVDDYLSYPGVTERSRARLDREERSIASRADLVIVTAENLLEIKRHLHSNILHVRNAVDDRTLEEGRIVGGPIPAELLAARKPLLGYIGGITEKLDLELLEKIAARLEGGSRGSLVLVGPVNVASRDATERIARLRSSPGVIFTGQRDAAEVPAFLRAFDVGLIPYRAGDQARSIDPLKLYEYLAFGKPVVAVDIPSVRPFRELVHIARDREEYLRLLDVAAADQDEALAARRRAIARDNSWEHRARQISDAVEAVLRAREKAAPAL